MAANHDGDSNSTASIAGQLYGAWHGVRAIPHRWVRRIDVIDPIWELTHDLIAASGPTI
jgi:ADP-ribosyl-[dinitrogen reductase] hydrolase